jgi:GT2 family glycosyltransferase
MADPKVTIIVVPRERFSWTEPSLEGLIAHTDPGVPLVYVDGGSPARVRRYLARRAAERGFRLVRVDRYLSPNEARNLGLAEVRTPYVCFVDNDTIVTPGWLDRLVACAEETGACVVGPLYLEGPLEQRRIHMTGGDIRFEQDGADRLIYATLRDFGRRLDDVSPLARGPVDYVEFHCLLARASLFERLGPLDEGLRCTREHIDLCMSARAAGGRVWLEPSAVVTYMAPPPFAPSDLPYFMLRWSEAWIEGSVRHFESKWRVRLGPRQTAIIRSHRYAAFHGLRGAARRALGGRAADWAESRLWFPVERRLNRWLVRDRARPAPRAAQVRAGHGAA